MDIKIHFETNASDRTNSDATTTTVIELQKNAGISFEIYYSHNNSTELVSIPNRILTSTYSLFYCTVLYSTVQYSRTRHPLRSTVVAQRDCWLVVVIKISASIYHVREKSIECDVKHM
jgi:hypothetical protein